ncbi:hypothetical protein BGZ91_009544 [Linnemannia elongata]|nr:hypothetical protein BGZ91_009544 [Linnemannia elongata]
MNQQRELMSQMQQQQQQQQQLQQHQHQLQQQQIHQQHLALQQQAPSVLQQPRQPGGVRANSGNQIPYPLQTTSSPSSPSASGSQPSSPNGSMTSLQPPSPAKANTNTFVHKLHNMVIDKQYQHLIAWNYTGTSFIVCNIMEFSRDVLPKHFKHNNFSSFVRQLNMYGFHKVNKSPRGHRTLAENQIWEFSHQKFLRGRQDLLDDIKRKAMESDAMRRDGADVSNHVTMLQSSQQDLAQQVTHLQANFGEVARELADTRRIQVAQQQLLKSLLDYIQKTSGGQPLPPELTFEHYEVKPEPERPPIYITAPESSTQQIYQNMMFNTLSNDNTTPSQRRPNSPLTIQTSMGGSGPNSPQNAPLHSPLSPHHSPLSPLSPLSPSFAMQNLGLGMNSNGNLNVGESNVGGMNGVRNNNAINNNNNNNSNPRTPSINIQIPPFYTTSSGLLGHAPQSPNTLQAYTSAVNTPLPPSPSPGSPLASMVSDNEMESSASLYCPSPGGPNLTGGMHGGRPGSEYGGSEYGGSEYGGDDGSHFFSMSS